MSAHKTMQKDERNHLRKNINNRTTSIINLSLDFNTIAIPKKTQNEKNENDEMFYHFENLTGQPMSH